MTQRFISRKHNAFGMSRRLFEKDVLFFWQDCSRVAEKPSEAEKQGQLYTSRAMIFS